MGDENAHVGRNCEIMMSGIATNTDRSDRADPYRRRHTRDSNPKATSPSSRHQEHVVIFASSSPSLRGHVRDGVGALVVT
jgi:hypothetical protein